MHGHETGLLAYAVTDGCGITNATGFRTTGFLTGIGLETVLQVVQLCSETVRTVEEVHQVLQSTPLGHGPHADSCCFLKIEKATADSINITVATNAIDLMLFCLTLPENRHANFFKNSTSHIYSPMH